MNTLTTLSLRTEGLMTIISLLLTTGLAWYALGALRWEVFFKDSTSNPSRMMRLLLSVILASGVTGFLLQYINGTFMMRG